MMKVVFVRHGQRELKKKTHTTKFVYRLKWPLKLFTVVEETYFIVLVK